MSTSISTLVLDIAAKESIRAARTALAPLGLFAHSFAEAASEVGDTIKVPVFSRKAAAEFGATITDGGQSVTNNYTGALEAGVAGKSIALNKHPWCSRRLLPDDDMETDAGRDWASQTTICAVESVAKYMAEEVIVGIMKNASVTALSPSGATNIAKVASIRKAVIAGGVNPADATLLLPATEYTDLISELPYNTIGAQSALVDGYVDRFLGFARVAEIQDGYTYTNSNSKLVTLNYMVIANDALGIATRLPKVQNADLYEVSTLSVPEVGPWSFQVRATGTNAVDAKFLGAEVIFGYALLQPAKIFVTATTAS